MCSLSALNDRSSCRVQTSGSCVFECPLSMLAVDSLVDGAINEGVSARVVARLAKQCPVPAIREMLREIAADEGRHAAHGWEVVRWCVEVGGEPVCWALRGALGALTPKSSRGAPASRHEDARRGVWERFGIPSDALEAEETDRTRRDVVARVLRLTDDATIRAEAS